MCCWTPTNNMVNLLCAGVSEQLVFDDYKSSGNLMWRSFKWPFFRRNMAALMGLEAVLYLFCILLKSYMLLWKLKCTNKVPQCIWSNNLIHMVEVIPLVNIQLNMLSHSLCSVDLSLLNRCCLNSDLCKFWSMLSLFSPLSWCPCVGLRNRNVGVSHIYNYFIDVQYCRIITISHHRSRLQQC